MNILILTNNLKGTKKFAEILNQKLSVYNIRVEVYDFQYVNKEIPESILNQYDVIFLLSYIIKTSKTKGELQLRYNNKLKETLIELLAREISKNMYDEYAKDKNFHHMVTPKKDPDFPKKLGTNTLSIKVFSKIREIDQNVPYMNNMADIFTEGFVSLPTVRNHIYKLEDKKVNPEDVLSKPIIKNYLDFLDEIHNRLSSEVEFGFKENNEQTVVTEEYSVEQNNTKEQNDLKEQNELMAEINPDYVLEKMNIIVDGHFIESNDLPVNLKSLDVAVTERYGDGRTKWIIAQNANTREILLNLHLYNNDDKILSSDVKKELVNSKDTSKYKSSKIIAIVDGKPQKAVYNNLTKAMNAVSNGYKNKEVMLQSIEDNEIVFYK